jgi:hypothetical protein
MNPAVIAASVVYIAQGTPQVFEKSIQAESSIGLLSQTFPISGVWFSSFERSIRFRQGA